MSRSSRVVVLCEDKRTQQFIRRFLQRLAYQNHEIRFSAIGSGSAEQRVREQFPREVAALQNSLFTDQFLITAIDADSWSVEKRIQQLENSMTDSGVTKAIPREKICLLVPRRNIETWIRVLCGDSADEETDYKPPPGGTRDQRFRDRTTQAGESFYRVTRPNARLPIPTVDSLNRAIPEARKVPRSSS